MCCRGEIVEMGPLSSEYWPGVVSCEGCSVVRGLFGSMRLVCRGVCLVLVILHIREVVCQQCSLPY